MNETLQVIAKRRSIRKYRPDQISDEEIREIMKAAIYAPSARNQQKWHFTVIQDETLIDEMAAVVQKNAALTGNEQVARFMDNPGFHVFFHAPTVVVVSYEAGEEDIFVEMDCGMAVQNILLAAQSMGIGSCTIGFSRFLLLSPEGVELLKGLKVPEGYRHLCAVSLGYPQEEHPKMPYRNMDVVTYIK